MYNLILFSSVASIMSLERTENVWLIEGAVALKHMHEAPSLPGTAPVHFVAAVTGTRHSSVLLP